MALIPSAICRILADFTHAPPRDYLDSLELRIICKEEVDDADVRAIFAHRKPLEFWGCPRLLVPKIVEAFKALQTEPAYLDVTITALPCVGTTRPWEAWPQVYTDYLPCHACTSLVTVEKERLPHLKHLIFQGPVGTVDFVIEKFHVSSKSFRKRLTVELHYQLKQGTSEIDRKQSSIIHKITIRLAGETCSAQEGLSVTVNRSRPTRMLLPDLASDVFGFLERAHVGSSLIANHDFHELICKLKNRLPVHHLMCAFEDELFRSGPRRCVSGVYLLEIRHFQRDLSYADSRRFKMPSIGSADGGCALIRQYLSNSHVADLLPPDADFHFAVKMLADLATRNFSVGRVELYANDVRLPDYRSMDVVFGAMRMRELDLNCEEHRYDELVKSIDLFRMSTVQRLRKLKLTLRREEGPTPPPPEQDAESPRPLWISGFCLLRNCEYYRVDYKTNHHPGWIERWIVQICEEFERGEITNTVGHFKFVTNSPTEMHYSFNRENLLVSGMKASGKMHSDQINYFVWDVYRFRNARTNGYLTACVGRGTHEYYTRYIVHILKGEVYPDASFADD